MLATARFAALRLGLRVSTAERSFSVTWAGRSIEIQHDRVMDVGARRNATSIRTPLTSPLRIGLSLVRGALDGRRISPAARALDTHEDPRLARARIHAVESDMARALLDGGLADELAATKTDVVIVDDEAVTTATWGSIYLASTLRRALDATTRIAARIESLAELATPAWFVRASAAIAELQGRGAIGPAVSVEAVLAEEGPAMRIVIRHELPADIPIFYVRFVPRRLLPILPPGPYGLSTGNDRFDARYWTLTGLGSDPRLLAPALEPAILAAVAERSPHSVSILRGPAFELEVTTSVPSTDAEELAREIDTWSEVGRRLAGA